MQIGEQLGTDWSRSEVSKVELKVDAFFSGFPSLYSPKTYAVLYFYLTVSGFPAVCTVASGLYFLLMSPVQQDSSLLTVSNILNHS